MGGGSRDGGSGRGETRQREGGKGSEGARNSGTCGRLRAGVSRGQRENEKGREREAARGQIVGDDRDEFVSFHAGKLSRSPRPMIYWATMW